MKKNLIALMTAAAILASGGAVFAETNIEIETQEDIMPISVSIDEEFTAPVSMPSYISKDVTVTEITEEKISTTLNGDDAENLENTVNYTILEETLVFNSKGEKKSIEDIKEGANITVFTSSYSPAPLILPTQYQADVVIIREEEESFLDFINVDTYFTDGEILVNAANTLALNISEDTEIVDLEGNTVDEDKLENNDLIVFYGVSTKSIPAQTTPEKVIVLGENEIALAQIEAAKNEENETPAPTYAPENEEDIEVDFTTIKSVTVGDKTITNIYVKDSSLMVPLREIAETLGLTVEWNDEMRAVVINSGIYSLQIGENSYVKGKMMPMELSVAPEIKDDLTYVPVEYFIEVVEAETNVELDDEENASSIDFNISETEAE